MIRFEPDQMQIFTCKDTVLLVRTDIEELPCPRCDRLLVIIVNPEPSKDNNSDRNELVCRCDWRAG